MEKEDQRSELQRVFAYGLALAFYISFILSNAGPELRWFVHGFIVAWLCYFIYQVGEFHEQLSENRQEVESLLAELENLKREVNTFKLQEIGQGFSRVLK